VFAATLLADLEAINSGVTMVADLAHIMNTPGHADAAVAAHHASGQRVLFAHGVPNDESAASWWSHSDRTHPDDIERLRHEVLSDDESLVTLGMFIRPPFLVTPRVLAHDITLARDLDIHMTMDGGVGGGCWGEGRWGDPGLRPVADIDRVGGLGPDLTLAHCNNLTAEEYDLIADSGTKISISPDHEMLCGHGLPATKNILEHGIEPGVSIDSVVAASGDMFAAMRSILTSTRGIWADRAYAGGTSIESWDITSRDVLRFATLRSAEANGMGTRTGSLTPGKRADIILLKSDPFNLTMLNNPVATVVTTAHPGNVDTVIIDGTIRKQDGKLIGQNIDAVITAAETSRRHVVGESGVDSAQRRSSEWAVFS
jgi:5-methylthioadenosine/S-adenosylhomocysteine deaminase